MALCALLHPSVMAHLEAWGKDVDWQSLFIADMPLLEIFLRGSIIYLTLFFLLRFVLKRQSGAIGVTDLLVVVLMADAAQNGMAGEYKSVPDGIALVCTLVFWNYFLEWMAFHFPRFERLIQPAPRTLIKNGRMHLDNMRHELISRDDLMSQLRQHGIDNIKRVKHACMEGDGKISIIEYGKNEQNQPIDTQT